MRGIGDRVSQRNFAPAEARRAHVDRERAFALARDMQWSRPAFQEKFGFPSVAHHEVGDTARAIAARVGNRAVIVVDHEPRGAPRISGIVQDHELIEDEPRHAIDGPRFVPADDVIAAAQVEHGNCIADAVHLHDGAVREEGHIRVPVPRHIGESGARHYLS